VIFSQIEALFGAHPEHSGRWEKNYNWAFPKGQVWQYSKWDCTKNAST